MHTPSVLICEDDFLLADALRDAVVQLGCTVAYCVGDIESASLAAADVESEVAIVDLNLRGTMAYGVLDALDQRGVPFILATAAADRNIPEKYAGAPRIVKPYSLDALRQAMVEIGAISAY